MFDTKKVILGLLALIMVFGSALPGQAADNKKSNKTETRGTTASKAPITIEGNELSFSDLTGQVFARGNVVVTQNGATMTTELLKGNTKQSLVWTESPATFTQAEVHLDGSGLRFNYKDNTGNMQQAAGKVDRQFVTGKNIEMLSTNEVIIHNGTMTTCPAIVPDYHVSADKVEIWPGDKLVAYNAKFWIKNTIIYSMPKYQKSLKKDGQSEFPRVGYNSSDGFSLRQYLEYPLSDKVAAFTDLGFYSKAGFKPQYGLVDREKNYSLSVVDGYYDDTDSNWIKKEPEFRFDYNSHRLGNLPVSYTFGAIYGKWTDDTKSSWHQDYNLYFSGDAIKLGRTANLYLGTGFQKVLESYDSSVRNVFRFDATLVKEISPRFSAWTGYHYVKNNTSLFSYNNDDLGRELDSGFTYKIDKLNSISYSQSYDLTNNRIYDQDYTWNRNLHCWQASITYRAKRQQLVWDLSTTRW